MNHPSYWDHPAMLALGNVYSFLFHNWWRLGLFLLALYLLTQKEFIFSVGWSDPAAALPVNLRPTRPVPTVTATAVAVPAAKQPAAKAVTAPVQTAIPDQLHINPLKATGEDRDARTYIRRFWKVAQKEQEVYGVPASIKLAQGLLESAAGSSALARRHNNHFGIKCFSRTCGEGHCANKTDDSHKDFFRVYASAWESYRAHSKLLVNGKYKSLLEHGIDYVAWAKGLKEIGYATNPLYDELLIDIIQRYRLDWLDTAGNEIPVAK